MWTRPRRMKTEPGTRPVIHPMVRTGWTGPEPTEPPLKSVQLNSEEKRGRREGIALIDS